MPGLVRPLAALRAFAPARCSRVSAPFVSSPRASPASALRTLSTSSRAFQRPTLTRAALGANGSSKASPPAAGSFFAQSYLPYSSRGSFFTPSRYLSTSATGLSAAPSTAPPVAPAAESETVEDVRTIPKSLPVWLLSCSALVFGIIVIGGLTRLTESGLSIVEWNPITGIRPPITDAEWDAEWEKYRVSPEGVM